ncbi:MAG: hypothetical protein JSW63_03745 [Ignavibacterium sp.]|nr:MAG: hypothetical protein JSW63_03745 [Ignavibacterium sp.]
MPFGRNQRTSKSSGCLGGFGGGCTSIVFFFIVIVYLLSSIDFPEFDIDLGSTETVGYNIHMDSLTTEKIINASFSWKFVNNGLKKKNYKLTFSLLAVEVKKAMDLIDKIGNMSLEELGLNPNYDYQNPQIQAQYVWARVYQIVYKISFPTITSIANGFNQIFINENLTSRDRLSFVISFVQNMKYERPGGILDLLAPLGSLAQRYGDCDTKAMLLYVLLERMGIDCAMMWSHNYKHALLGINISTRGDYKKLNGKKYYFLETTYPGWSIGKLPPEFRNKSYWIIDEIDSSSNFSK